ncbi:MAG: hypothetical protein ACXVCY_03405 [Pseudobdellovibrionaceae bacterium]
MDTENNIHLIWVKIIDSDIYQLIEMQSHSFQMSISQKIYINVLIAYLKSDLSELKKCVIELEQALVTTSDLTELQLITAISKSRLEICKRDISEQTIMRLKSLECLPNYWTGEVHFVIARALGIQKEYLEQQKYYFTAAYHLEQAGANRKGVMALQNVYAVEGRIKPEKRLTVEYNFLLEKALKFGEYRTAGLCAINISRELQLLGTKQLALRYSNRALDYLKHDLGTQHYGLALCHHAQLLIENFRIEEAQNYIEEASLVEFAEVQSAVYILKNILADKVVINDAKTLANSWVDRNLNGPYRKLNFGEIETKLIELLSFGPANRNEILDKLFRHELDHLDFETVINRFKNLLMRIKKKAPNLIVKEDNKYRISGASEKFHLIKGSV